MAISVYAYSTGKIGENRLQNFQQKILSLATQNGGKIEGNSLCDPESMEDMYELNIDIVFSKRERELSLFRFRQ